MTASRIKVLLPQYRTIVLALTVTASAQIAVGGQFDWPQWQGPERTANSKETGLLAAWPKDGPPLAWSPTIVERGTRQLQKPAHLTLHMARKS